MRSALLLLALAVFGALPARACLWTYGTDLRGQRIAIEDLDGDHVVRDLRDFETRAEWESRKTRLRDWIHGDFRKRNDYAVILLHLGETVPAIFMLEQIEREQPGQYETAANLGTAYELAGRARTALEWIRTSISRDPGAHNGTEWLHVRILEAKLALASDPHWLERHSILGIDFGEGPIAKQPTPLPPGNDGKPVSLEALKNALWYQLSERYQFVSPRDGVVGSLLFDWANVLYRTSILESAAAMYEESIRYGAPRMLLAKTRLARVREILRDHQQRRK